MLPTWIFGIFWVAASLVAMSFSLAVVYYNVVFIMVEVVALIVLRKLRHSLRLIAVPWRWRQRQAVVKLKDRMHAATTFEEWLHAARELDDLEGGTPWRMERSSDDFDVDLIVQSTKRLRTARRARDISHLMLVLRSVVHRGYGGIARPNLYEHAYTGTKTTLEAFVTEVCSSIAVVADAEDVPEPVRASFIDALRVQLGRTALALSGGGALALAHMGVVRTLLCAGLLPRVISGTSGGSMIAGIMASHTDEELLDKVLVPGIVSAHGPQHVFFGPPWQQVHHFLTTGRLVDNERFSSVLRKYMGDDTFLTAFQKTGRIINISVVARAGPNASYNLQLNYVTSPQVLIWSAVAASCALPGLMRPVTIMAVDDQGRQVPYHTSGVQTIDGSMAVDVPRRDLGQLFHVDTLLVSQANPHVVPFLKLVKDSVVPGGRGAARLDDNPISRALAAASLWLLLDMRHRMHLLVGLRLLPKWFGEESGPLFVQSYTGDVTFVPHQSPLEAWRALAQPTEVDMAKLILDGQRATWPHLAHVRTLVAIEKRLSLCARRFARVGMGQAVGHLAMYPVSARSLGALVFGRALMPAATQGKAPPPSSSPPIGYLRGQAEAAGGVAHRVVAESGDGTGQEGWQLASVAGKRKRYSEGGHEPPAIDSSQPGPGPAAGSGGQTAAGVCQGVADTAAAAAAAAMQSIDSTLIAQYGDYLHRRRGTASTAGTAPTSPDLAGPVHKGAAGRGYGHDVEGQGHGQGQAHDADETDGGPGPATGEAPSPATPARIMRVQSYSAPMMDRLYENGGLAGGLTSQSEAEALRAAGVMPGPVRSMATGLAVSDMDEGGESPERRWTARQADAGPAPPPPPSPAASPQVGLPIGLTSSSTDLPHMAAPGPPTMQTGWVPASPGAIAAPRVAYSPVGDAVASAGPARVPPLPLRQPFPPTRSSSMEADGHLAAVGEAPPVHPYGRTPEAMGRPGLMTVQPGTKPARGLAPVVATTSPGIAPAGQGTSSAIESGADPGLFFPPPAPGRASPQTGATDSHHGLVADHSHIEPGCADPSWEGDIERLMDEYERLMAQEGADGGIDDSEGIRRSRSWMGGAAALYAALQRSGSSSVTSGQASALVHALHTARVHAHEQAEQERDRLAMSESPPPGTGLSLQPLWPRGDAVSPVPEGVRQDEEEGGWAVTVDRQAQDAGRPPLHPQLSHTGTMIGPPVGPGQPVHSLATTAHPSAAAAAATEAEERPPSSSDDETSAQTAAETMELEAGPAPGYVEAPLPVAGDDGTGRTSHGRRTAGRRDSGSIATDDDDAATATEATASPSNGRRSERASPSDHVPVQHPDSRPLSTAAAPGQMTGDTAIQGTVSMADVAEADLSSLVLDDGPGPALGSGSGPAQPGAADAVADSVGHPRTERAQTLAARRATKSSNGNKHGPTHPAGLQLSLSAPVLRGDGARAAGRHHEHVHSEGGRSARSDDVVERGHAGALTPLPGSMSMHGPVHGLLPLGSSNASGGRGGRGARRLTTAPATASGGSSDEDQGPVPIGTAENVRDASTVYRPVPTGALTPLPGGHGLGPGQMAVSGTVDLGPSAAKSPASTGAPRRSYAAVLGRGSTSQGMGQGSRVVGKGSGGGAT